MADWMVNCRGCWWLSEPPGADLSKSIRQLLPQRLSIRAGTSRLSNHSDNFGSLWLLCHARNPSIWRVQITPQDDSRHVVCSQCLDCHGVVQLLFPVGATSLYVCASRCGWTGSGNHRDRYVSCYIYTAGPHRTHIPLHSGRYFVARAVLIICVEFPSRYQQGSFKLARALADISLQSTLGYTRLSGTIQC